FGQFFHFNTVDEVAHGFGANGAMLQTGQIYATQPLHGGNSFLKDPTNPEYFLVLTVTQHQRASGPQAEAVIFRCGKCHEVLERYEYDAQPAPRGVHPRNGVPLFTTLQGSVDAAETLNEHPSNRHCASCGYDNPSFPLERWGWRQYVQQTRTVNDARHALDAAAAPALGSTEAPREPWSARASGGTYTSRVRSLPPGAPSMPPLHKHSAVRRPRASHGSQAHAERVQ